MSEPNPYTAPQSEVTLPLVAPVELRVVSRWLRLANLLIDYIAQLGIGFMIGLLIALLGLADPFLAAGKLGEYGLGVLILLFYYTLVEGLFGVSLGKLITGTKVVNQDGSRLSFKGAIKRSLCRLIPFEAFSFLGSKSSRHDFIGGEAGRYDSMGCKLGWHDSISKTLVVKR